MGGWEGVGTEIGMYGIFYNLIKIYKLKKLIFIHLVASRNIHGNKHTQVYRVSGVSGFPSVILNRVDFFHKDVKYMLVGWLVG